jgi:hypothetical protein
MNMTEHFLADYHDWKEPTAALEELIEVPIRRVAKADQWVGDPPFLVFGCTWHHRNSQGPLTKEKFEADLAGALADFAREVNAHEEFIAYPITHVPPTVLGIAYHDWTGAAYPFDLRAVMTLDEAIPVPGEVDTIEAGLTFNLLTLISRDMVQKC